MSSPGAGRGRSTPPWPGATAQELASAGLRGGSSQPGLDRRAALGKVVATVTLASFAAVTAGIVAAVGRMFGATTGHVVPPTSTGVTTTTAAGSPTTATGGTVIGLAEQVPVGGALEFTDPAQQIPAYVVQPSRDAFVAFSAVCTHMGCTVGFYQPALQFRCPCHGSIFSAITGEVMSRPGNTTFTRNIPSPNPAEI